MIESRVADRARTVLLFGSAVALAILTNSRATATLSADTVAAPTFNSDVAPILFQKCATCHRPGAGGPMSLTSFREVRPWARSIKARVTKREMPPWSADPRFGIVGCGTEIEAELFGFEGQSGRSAGRSKK